MKVKDVHVDYRVRPHSPDAPRDALQTLSGGGSVGVRIVADDGLEGTSDTHLGRVDGGPATLATLIREILRPVVLGAEVDRIGATVDAMKAEVEYVGESGITTCGISAVDTALWDLLGKAHGVPCYRLWAPYRDRLPAYAMVGWANFDLDQLRIRCRRAVEQGFRGVKMKVGAGTLEEDIKRIEAVRSEVGNDVALMVDANQVFGLAEAIRCGEEFQSLGLSWFEEPLPKDDLDGYAELTRRLSIPVATGENLYGARAFAPFLERRACGVIQPDLRRGGGPTELRTVGALAEVYNVPYASHGGGPAALSLLMAAPTAVWLETGLRSGPDDFPRLEDGRALAPEGPGFSWA